MTIEEIHEVIKSMRDYADYRGFQESAEMYDIELKALDKQIPKPKHKCMGYRCVCGKEVAKNQDYCEYCGQRLLPWEDKK